MKSDSHAEIIRIGRRSSLSKMNRGWTERRNFFQKELAATAILWLKEHIAAKDWRGRVVGTESNPVCGMHDPEGPGRTQMIHGFTAPIENVKPQPKYHGSQLNLSKRAHVIVFAFWYRSL